MRSRFERDRCNFRGAAGLLALLCAMLSVAAWAETAYVSDEYAKIMVRRGQGNKFAILAQLKSGTPVEVLGREKGYTRILTPAGTEGWVISRFLVDTAPASAGAPDAVTADAADIGSATPTRGAAVENTKVAQAQPTALPSRPPAQRRPDAGAPAAVEAPALAVAATPATPTTQAPAAELGLTDTTVSQESTAAAEGSAARSAPSVDGEPGVLLDRISELERQLRELESSDDNDATRRDFMLLGAGILLAGLLLGLLLPHLGRRSVPDW